MSLKAKAREYAALRPDWFKPGMRCVDPETGRVWRKDDTTDFWVGVVGLYSAWVSVAVSTADYGKSIARAIAAGPDLDDAATVGALLLGLSVKNAVEVLRQSRWARDVSMAGTHNKPASEHDDWKLYLINACIAQAGGTQCSRL